MKKFLFLCFLSLMGTLYSHAQFINDGAVLYNNDVITCIMGSSLTFENKAGSSFTGVNGNNFEHAVATFINNGTYTCQTNFHDKFKGPNGAAGTQTISGTVRPNFYSVDVDNGAASLLQITNANGINISGAFFLRNGITTTNRSFTHQGAVRLDGASAAITGTSIGDGQHVDGYVSKAGFFAGSFYPLHVGSGTDWRPLQLQTNANSTDEVSVAWIVGDPSSTGDPSNANAMHSVSSLGPGIMGVSTAGQWDWVPVSGTGSGIQIRAMFPDMTGFAAAGDLRLVGWNGSMWVNLSSGATATFNTENWYVDGVATAGIEALAIGRTSSALPVNFKGTSIKKTTDCSARISWQTEAEENIELFKIQRSSTGSNWTTIGTVSPNQHQYVYEDRIPLEGVSIYKVVAAEKDGSSKSSNIVSFNNDCNETKISFYPNPVETELHINGISENCMIKVLDATGRQLHAMANAATFYTIKTASWPKGVYFVQIIKDGVVKTSHRVTKH